MRKTLSFCLFCLILFNFMASTAHSQSAEKVLNNVIKAWGGRAALEKIKDTVITGNLDLIQFGMSGSVIVSQKEPNKLRLDIELMGMVISQAYDGEVAWGTNPQTGSTEIMPEQQVEYFKRESYGNSIFLNPKKFGISFAVKGKENIEGKDYILLEQTFSDGFQATHYVDPGTYLIYKTKSRGLNQMGAEVDTETYLSDYKKVNGIMVAYGMTSFQDGEEYMTVTITEVKFNTGLEDAFFKMSE